MKTKFTVKEFNKKYPNDEKCLEAIWSARYEDLKVCPTCKKETTFHKRTDKKAYSCAKDAYANNPYNFGLIV